MRRHCLPVLVVLCLALSQAACGRDAPTPAAAPVTTRLAPTPAPATPPQAVIASAAPACVAPETVTAESAGPETAAAEKASPEGQPGADPLAVCHARLKRFVQACVEGKDTEAEAKDLVLRDPRAWFAGVFGADHPRLEQAVAAYEREVADIAALPAAIRAEHDAGHTQILVERFVHHTDEQATGAQALALRQMRTPTALYSLRLLAPYEDVGWHLGSFVCVDGVVRYVGDMEALLTEANQQALGALGTMRIEAARKLRPGWMTQD